MENQTEFKQSEGIRFVKWIADNQEEFRKICTCGNVLMKPDEVIKIIQLLEQEEFYTLMIIL